MVVVDGRNMIFGRIASRIAKKALNGEEVQLINAEQIVISGRPKATADNLRLRKKAQNKGTPEHSPKWPKVPHMLVKRMIRGMLPWKRTRGREAYRRVMVYTGNPKNLVPGAAIETATMRKGAKYITILQLCRMIGYSG
jgi:large subunit ribosomal protein L13